MMRRSINLRHRSSLSTIASDTTLDTLERRWLDAEQSRTEMPRGRTLDALVDRRFQYLGKESTRSPSRGGRGTDPY